MRKIIQKIKILENFYESGHCDKEEHLQMLLESLNERLSSIAVRKKIFEAITTSKYIFFLDIKHNKAQKPIIPFLVISQVANHSQSKQFSTKTLIKHSKLKKVFECRLKNHSKTAIHPKIEEFFGFLLNQGIDLSDCLFLTDKEPSWVKLVEDLEKADKTSNSYSDLKFFTLKGAYSTPFKESMNGKRIEVSEIDKKPLHEKERFLLLIWIEKQIKELTKKLKKSMNNNYLQTILHKCSQNQ